MRGLVFCSWKIQPASLPGLRVILSCSEAGRIVLLHYFVNGEDTVSSVIVLNQNCDIRDSSGIVPAISHHKIDSIRHQELVFSWPESSNRAVNQLEVPLRPAAP